MYQTFTYHKFFLVFAIFFTVGVTRLLAQPEQYGCHLLHYAQNQRILTESEQAEILAGIERSDSFDILNYEITVDLTRFSSSLLQANTIVSFRPLMDDLVQLRFDLEGLEVDSIFFDRMGFTWKYDGRYIEIAFAEALTKSEIYDIRVYYHGRPIICNEGFGGFYFEDDVAYNLGIGIDCIPHNYGRAWFPCFDNFVERSTYKYNIISSKGRIGYGLGELVDEIEISSDTIMRSYVMSQPIPTYLSHIAAGAFTEVNYIANSEYKPVPVQLVVKPKDSTNAKKHFEQLEDALNMLEYWYGPYMWDMIGYHMTSRGAMEHPTGVAYPSGVLSGRNLGLQTHELAHHWWGNIVTLETDADMWIKEGPSAYAEHQVIEYVNGEKAFKAAVKSNNLNMLRTAHISDDGYLPLSPMPQRITYGVHTYNKGSSMIHNLRTYLGDSLFRQGMQYVQEEKAYGNLTAYTFRDLLMEGTSIDLTDFFNDWILSPGWADFALDSYDIEEKNNSHIISGKIKQSQYHSGHYHKNVPLQLSVFFQDLTSIDTVIYATDEFTDFSFTTLHKPTAIIVNNDYNLCLASVTSSVEVTKEETLNHSSIPVTVFCSAYNEEDIVIMEHHYTAPQPFRNEGKRLELSDEHYWKIAFANPDANQYGFNYRINGGDTNSLDYNVFIYGLDSLVLLYKANENLDWVEVNDYELIRTGANTGVVVNREVKAGLYTLARGQRGIYTNIKQGAYSDIQVYPTLIEQGFSIEGIAQGGIELYDLNGRLIKSQEILQSRTFVEMPIVLPGLYILNIHDESKRLVSSQKIIKK